MATTLTDRRLVACGTCNWVHYAMSEDEKALHDNVLARYDLSAHERRVYEAQFQQCLRCESPATDFHLASEREIARALGHIVTPVMVQR